MSATTTTQQQHFATNTTSSASARGSSNLSSSLSAVDLVMQGSNLHHHFAARTSSEDDDHGAEELDDFDFKAMLSTMDVALAFPASHNSSGFFHNSSSFSSRMMTPPPLPTPPSAMPRRLSRSNSGHIISSRLRCASDMHQQGLLSQDEKSFMKDLILSRNARFTDELAHAERTNNWQHLSHLIRSAKLGSAVHNNLNTNTVIDSLANEFDSLSRSGSAFGGGGADEADDLQALFKSVNTANASTINNKKRMASNSFGRFKKKEVPENAPPVPVALSPATPPAARLQPLSTSSSHYAAHPLSHPPFTASSTASSAASTATPSPAMPYSASSTKNIDLDDASAAPLDEHASKMKKNERERRRRLAVSNGFDELFVLLKLPQSSKIDKVSILRKAIDRIQELEDVVRSNGLVLPPPRTATFATNGVGLGDDDDED